MSAPKPLLVSLFLALALLAALPVPAARADEGEVHAVVSDEVLDLLGLDTRHTLVVGARLPAVGGGRLRDALSPANLKETLTAIFEQNADEILVPFEREVYRREGLAGDAFALPSTLAVAVTLGDRDVAQGWQPFGLEWLRVDEITVVFAFDPGSPWADLNARRAYEAVRGKKREGGYAGIDDGGLMVALVGSAQAGRHRFTCAIAVDRQVDFVGKLRTKREAARPLETNSTSGHDRPDATDDEIASTAPAGKDTDVSHLVPRRDTQHGDGTVPAGTKARADLQGETTVTLSLLAEKLDPRTIVDVAALLGVDAPLPDVLDNRLFVVRDAMIALELDPTAFRRPRELVQGLSVLGTVELFAGRLAAKVLCAIQQRERRWSAYAGVRLEEVELKDLAPALDGSPVGDLWLPSVGFVYASAPLTVRNADLTAPEVAFFDDLLRPYGGAVDVNYTLRLVEGANLKGPLPLAFLPQSAMRALGIVDDVRGPSASADAASRSTAARGPYAILEGTPGISLGLRPSLPRLSDMALRAALPPISPARGPAWLVQGQLYVDVTGAPSIALGGSLTVDLKGDRVTFFVEGGFARSGAGFSVSLVGGLEADAAWRAPFGIEWLTLHQVVAKISIDTTGSVGLGFAADVEVGTKRVGATLFVAVNVATGVPTNLVVEGQVDALALRDVAALAARISGGRVPTGALPDVELRDVYFRFAPKADVDLGVEAGFALAGSAWVARAPGAERVRVAAVDGSITLDGLVLGGAVAGFEVGPVRFDDATLDVELTLARQVVALHGAATVGGKRLQVAVALTGRGLLEDARALAGDLLAGKLDAARAAAERLRSKVPTLRGSARKRPLRKLLGR